ncbi:peptidoglycan DD-metalloendopeptidase family protein [Phormidium sp. CLA17]|nr:peptidoglycan DD-metalloendopeptidase family protein [Leptolyngbya sp. Cla-17]
MQGIAWIGGVSALSGGMAIAQTPTSDPFSAAPAPQPVTAPVETTPIAPVTPPVAPESFPSEFSAPSPAVPQYQTPVVVVPAAVAPSSRSTQTTETYTAPSAIIFSERSSGCQATVRSGQVPDGLCGGASGGDRGYATTQPFRSGQLAVNGETTASQLSSLPAVQVSTLVATVTGINPGTPSLQDYYRRTMRPPAKLGNGNIQLLFPLSIPAAISSVFGWRMHPISGDARFHSGTDLAAPMGTPVLAAYAGQVVLADLLGGYGLAVALDHNKGTAQTLYAHLSEIFVKSGEVVKQGDVIGRVGSTGNSTGPHLHFEFRQLTTEGWVVLDAGSQLEYALAQLVRSLDFAQAPTQSAKANAGIEGVL